MEISKKDSLQLYLQYTKHLPATTEEKDPVLILVTNHARRKKRLLLREMVEAVERFSQQQNISKEEALTVNECHRTWHTPDNPTKCTIPVVNAKALLYNVNLSTFQYQMIRNVVFPDIDKCKVLFHSEITSCSNPVRITSLLYQTASSLVKLNSSDGDVNRSYHLVGKFGVDRFGSHKIHQQLIKADIAKK